MEDIAPIPRSQEVTSDCFSKFTLVVKDFYSIRLTWVYWPKAWLLKAGSPLSTSRDLWTTYKASWNNLWQGNSLYLCPRWKNVPGTLLIFSFPSEAYGPCPMQEDSQNLGLAENRGCFDTEGQIPPTRSRMKNPHQHVTSKQTRYEWILVQHSTVLWCLLSYSMHWNSHDWSDEGSSQTGNCPQPWHLFSCFRVSSPFFCTYLEIHLQ